MAKWKKRFWTPEEVAYLTAQYPNVRTDEIAAHLGRPIHQVYAKAKKLERHKTESFFADPANGARLHKGMCASPGTCFRKGNVPFNKGVRMPGYAPGRMAETQFRKGVRSGIAAKYWLPVGTIKADSDGYLRLKVREAVHGQEPTGYGNTNVWPFYHRVIWEQHNGPVPAGHIVTFKDGDKTNCVIENLQLLSKADNARRNGMWRSMPRELAEVIQLQGVLKRKIRKINGQKHD